MNISGTTRVYAHIGHPIGHVRAPGLFNQLVNDRDIDAVMIPVEVTPAELPSLVPGFRAWRNLAGVGVTIPHKETMTQLVDELTPMARLCGATNVIRRQEDGTLLGGQVDAIPALLQLARRTRRIVRQNLAWAAAYNAVCVPLALAGWMPPWLAGLGMACSSLFVVANAARLATNARDAGSRPA